MRRLILHVGTHKTGTTAVQEFLLDNADLLAAQGICFPRMPARRRGVKIERNGNFLCWHAREAFEPHRVDDEMHAQTKANVTFFLQEAPLHEAMLLSEEMLWYEGCQNNRFWSTLKALFAKAGFETVDVIVYLRRQDSFAASLWNQRVKDGVRVRSTIEQYVSGERLTNAMDYDAGIKALEAAFGKEHISVRVFDRSNLEEGDIRHDFCTCAGIELTPDFVFRTESTNPGLTATVAEIKRQANYVPEYRDTDNFLRNPAVSVSALSQGKDNTSKLPPEMVQEIFARYAEGNARIAREYLHREDGVLFRSAPTGQSTVPQQSASTDELLRETIRFFTAALAQEHEARLALESQVAKLEQRTSGLNASLGIISRIRRKLWRNKQSR